MRVVGLDIGGANLKAADADGRALSLVFPMWTDFARLPQALHEILLEFAPAELIAVTMTAELADCFATKAGGVEFILRAVEEAVAGTPVVIWQTGAEFVSPEVAREIPLLVAAANWRALATWTGRMVPEGTALLVDIGSTTTDLIPLLDGVPVPAGLTDVDRLQSGELVYTGVRRTPLCAVAASVRFRGRDCPLAAELFATMLDVYLILGRIPEDASDRHTANGKPATADAAHDRLARMLCCDRTEVSRHEAREIAALLADAQKRQIGSAIERVAAAQPVPFSAVLIAGSGAFLAGEIASDHPRLSAAERIMLSEIVQPGSAEAACAFAVARLAAERLG